MSYYIITFLFGGTIGFIFSLLVLHFYTKSIQIFISNLTHIIRKDNAKYMASSLEDFKIQLTEEIAGFQEKLQSELTDNNNFEDFEDDDFGNSGNNNNSGGFLN